MVNGEKTRYAHSPFIIDHSTVLLTCKTLRVTRRSGYRVTRKVALRFGPRGAKVRRARV
jgi:hypothetical protein